MNSNLSPIALFVYNRLVCLKQTVESLQNNKLADESELFIFSDAPKGDANSDKVSEVRDYIKKLAGFKKITVIERDRNFGLAKSITSGVTELIDQYGKVIVLEDDLITSPYFLKFMNDALEEYESEDKVISIHGYIYPVKSELPETFFLRGADCWGWATWKRGWELYESNGERLLRELQEKKLERVFDINGAYSYTKMLKKQVEGKNNSWAVRWHASAFLKDKLTLYPGKSLVNHIGNDADATHYYTLQKFDVLATDIHNKPVSIKKISCKENREALKEIEIFFRKAKKYFILNRILGLFFKR